MTVARQKPKRRSRVKWQPGDLRYRENPRAPKPPWWNEPTADRVVHFFRTVLCHTKGEWYGKPFELLYWQEAFLRDVFGPTAENGFRLVRDAWLEVPRKNGKTELVAGIGLYLLVMDNEPGAEIYGAAADKEQASLTFNAAKTMVSFSPGLSKRLTVYKATIAWEARQSFYRSLSSDAFTKHGLNAHGILFDEVHAQPTSELWDVLATSTGARRQPLTIGLTTAGHDRTTLAWRLHEYYRGIMEGTIHNPKSVAYIYGASPKCKWKDPRVWDKVNPSLGQAVKEEYLANECQRATDMPSLENTFKRLHLNIWTSSEERWLNMTKWDDCPSDYDRTNPTSLKVYAGLDLSSKIDLTSLALYFPETKVLDVYFWLPEGRVRFHKERNKLPFEQWVKEGWLFETAGDVVDQAEVFRRMQEILAPFDVQELGYDSWNAGTFQTWMDDAGLPLVDMRQGFRALSAPSKELERLIQAGELNHGGNPLMRWNAENTNVRRDENENIRPIKGRDETKRIDGVVASIMAIGRADLAAGGSVYDDRGVFTIGENYEDGQEDEWDDE